MRTNDNIYHQVAVLALLVLALIVTLFVCRKDSGEKDPVPVPVVKEGEFFKVGKYGNTIILDVATERTNGKLEKQTHEAGKEARFLNGS